MGLQTENYDGNDCTGSSGTASRTLTISNTLETQDDSFLVIVSGLVLIPTSDFTVDHNSSSSVITFVNALYDDQKILVQYGEGFVQTTSGYCSGDNVSVITNITTDDISSADMTNIIAQATVQVNQDINVQVERERISYIDETRENKIDSSNTTYYVRNWKGKFLADRNNDGSVTTSDVIVYQVSSDGTETTPTISSIDDDACSVTLETAPSANNEYYISYAYTPVREGTVDSRVKLSTIFLTAAFCYAKLNIGCAPSVSFGSTRITKHMDSFKHYYDRYLDIIAQINSLEEIHSKVSEDTF